MPDFEDPDESNRDSDGTPERRYEGTHPTRARFRSLVEQTQANWKAIAMVGGGIAIAGVASVVTLALTHNSAVAENEAAFTNGLLEGLAANVRAHLNGYGHCLEDYGFDDDWFDY